MRQIEILPQNMFDAVQTIYKVIAKNNTPEKSIVRIPEYNRCENYHGIFILSDNGNGTQLTKLSDVQFEYQLLSIADWKFKGVFGCYNCHSIPKRILEMFRFAPYGDMPLICAKYDYKNSVYKIGPNYEYTEQ